jgi:hypothetical protein
MIPNAMSCFKICCWNLFCFTKYIEETICCHQLLNSILTWRHIILYFAMKYSSFTFVRNRYYRWYRICLFISYQTSFVIWSERLLFLQVSVTHWMIEKYDVLRMWLDLFCMLFESVSSLIVVELAMTLPRDIWDSNYAIAHQWKWNPRYYWFSQTWHQKACL